MIVLYCWGKVNQSTATLRSLTDSWPTVVWLSVDALADKSVRIAFVTLTYSC